MKKARRDVDREALQEVLRGDCQKCLAAALARWFFEQEQAEARVARMRSYDGLGRGRAR